MHKSMMIAISDLFNRNEMLSDSSVAPSDKCNYTMCNNLLFFTFKVYMLLLLYVVFVRSLII